MGVADLHRSVALWTKAQHYVPKRAITPDDDVMILVPRTAPDTHLALDVSESRIQQPPRVHLDLYAGDAADQAARSNGWSRSVSPASSGTGTRRIPTSSRWPTPRATASASSIRAPADARDVVAGLVVRVELRGAEDDELGNGALRRERRRGDGDAEPSRAVERAARARLEPRPRRGRQRRRGSFRGAHRRRAGVCTGPISSRAAPPSTTPAARRARRTAAPPTSALDSPRPKNPSSQRFDGAQVGAP